MHTKVHAITLLALTSSLAAQVPVHTLDQREDGPNPPRLRIDDRWSSAPVLLFGTQRSTPIAVPGVHGTLALTPNGLNALPWAAGRSLELLAQLRNRVPGAVYYQILNASASGSRFSRLVSLDQGKLFRQQDSQAVCFARAQRRLDEVRGTDMAPGWENAKIRANPTPMYRPDVNGIAYYEFAVAPQGFFVVSTGTHDFPVPHWNHVGEPIRDYLTREARKHAEHVQKIYKLDTLCYAAENARGKRIATLGTVPLKLSGLPTLPAPLAYSDKNSGVRFAAWSSWDELKRDYTKTYRPLILDLASQAADLWRVERTPVIEPMGWSSWTTYVAGSSSDQRDYWQHTVGSCASGCGPTALAMLYGWGDKQAHDGVSYWSSRKGLYRCGGTTTGSTSCIAPSTLTSTVESIIEEIRTDVGTWCITGSGATNPWDMQHGQDYLNPRTGTDLDTHWNSVGIHEKRLREYARNSIRDRDTPAIIGTGWLTHYPLAWKYRYRTKKVLFSTVYDREFYVNNGWYGTSGDGWVSAGTWFAGEIYP